MTIKEYFILRRAKKKLHQLSKYYPIDDTHNSRIRLLYKTGLIVPEIDIDPKNNSAIYTGYQLTDRGQQALDQAFSNILKVILAYIAGVMTPILTYLIMNWLHVVTMKFH